MMHFLQGGHWTSTCSAGRIYIRGSYKRTEYFYSRKLVSSAHKQHTFNSEVCYFQLHGRFSVSQLFSLFYSVLFLLNLFTSLVYNLRTELVISMLMLPIFDDNIFSSFQVCIILQFDLVKYHMLATSWKNFCLIIY